MVSVITQVSIKIYSCYCSSHFPQYMCIVFGESHNHSPHPTDAVVRATPASIYQTFLLIWDFTNNHKCCSLPKISALSFLDRVSGKTPLRAPVPWKKLFGLALLFMHFLFQSSERLLLPMSGRLSKNEQVCPEVGNGHCERGEKLVPLACRI